MKEYNRVISGMVCQHYVLGPDGQYHCESQIFIPDADPLDFMDDEGKYLDDIDIRKQITEPTKMRTPNKKRKFAVEN